MNARTARKLTADNLKGPVIEPLLRIVHAKIEAAAKGGHSCITHPFSGLRMPYPSEAARKAVWEALRADGYEVEHCPDPDPGHPASSPYDRISW